MIYTLNIFNLKESSEKLYKEYSVKAWKTIYG